MNLAASTVATVIGVCLVDTAGLELEPFALACGTDPDFIRQLVDEGLLQPALEQPDWRFGGEELTRVRRICRLQRDFEANLQSVAVMLDLMDEVERLRSQWLRAGMR